MPNPREMAKSLRENTNLLHAAAAAVADREKKYGPPEVCLTLVAELWEAAGISRGGTTAADVAMAMILLKVARFMHGGSTAEGTLIDIAGYAECANRIVQQYKENIPMELPLEFSI